jgi:hypothetical protein
MAPGPDRPCLIAVDLLGFVDTVKSSISTGVRAFSGDRAACRLGVDVGVVTGRVLRRTLVRSRDRAIVTVRMRMSGWCGNACPAIGTSPITIGAPCTLVSRSVLRNCPILLTGLIGSAASNQDAMPGSSWETRWIALDLDHDHDLTTARA